MSRNFGTSSSIREIDIMVGRLEIPITMNAWILIEPREFCDFARTEEEIKALTESTVTRLKDKLSAVGGGVIWWRIRPEMSEAVRGWGHDEDPKFASEKRHAQAKMNIGWHNYMRFATSPELPAEFLDTLQQDRAERIKLIDHAIAELEAST